MVKDIVNYNDKEYQISTIYIENMITYETMIFPIEGDMISGHEVYCFRTTTSSESQKKHADILYYPEKYLSQEAITKYKEEKETNMINGDIFTSPIDFAIQTMMKNLENTNNDNDKCIYEALKRSKIMWEKIRIHGLETCGMTYDQFCKQLETNRNIVFLSDSGMDNFKKATQIMEIIKG